MVLRPAPDPRTVTPHSLPGHPGAGNLLMPRKQRPHPHAHAAGHPQPRTGARDRRDEYDPQQQRPDQKSGLDAHVKQG